MRLINVHSFAIEQFYNDEDIPKYAILSHTWGSEGAEVQFQDVGKMSDQTKQPIKFSGCCSRARADGIRYVWIDTCCIDQTNSVELGEAINSMFRWYREAQVCYAYLADVSGKETKAYREVAKSRWFTRGWTLQELLAPKELEFFTADWELLGTRSNLSHVVQKVTGISQHFLDGMIPISEASVAQRMSWAAGRQTKRPEDIAYSLLGIFDVTMSMRYGEGKRAFKRLQETIISEIHDLSIFAWGINDEGPEPSGPGLAAGGLLAASPDDFHFSRKVVSRRLPHEVSSASFGLHKHIIITAPVEVLDDEHFLLLGCGPFGQLDTFVGVPFRAETSNESEVRQERYYRPTGAMARHLKSSRKAFDGKTSYSLRMAAEKKVDNYGVQKHWFYIDKDPDQDFKLIHVVPHDAWRQEDSMISTANPVGVPEPKHYYVVYERLSTGSQFLVALPPSDISSPSYSCFIQHIERDTFPKVVKRLESSSLNIHKDRSASDDNFTVSISLVEDEVAAAIPMLILSIMITLLPQPDIIPRSEAVPERLRQEPQAEDPDSADLALSDEWFNSWSDTRDNMSRKTEQLDRRFVKQRKPSKFFIPGRVLKVLWPEPAANSGSSDHITKTYLGEAVFSKVRWFVVVKPGNSFCICVPIMTYAGRGMSKPGVKTNEHAVVHTGKLRTSENSAAPGALHPIRIKPREPGDRMSSESVVHFAKMYTVEHNFKVFDFGMVVQEHIQLLLLQWKEVTNRVED